MRTRSLVLPDRLGLLLLGFLLLGLCSCGEKRRAQPVAVDGTLDLSDWDFENDGPRAII